MEDDNDILIEEYIFNDISFSGGISGTTAVLVDAKNIFGKIAFKESQFKNKIWSMRNT